MAGRQRQGGHILRHPPQAHLLEERISNNHREIQALLADNKQLVATHTALRQDLSIAEQELQQLAAVARKVRDDREYEVKGLYERSLKIEDEFRVNGIDALQGELSQVRNDVQRLTEIKIELSSKFKAIEGEFEKAKVGVIDVPAIRADIDNMRQELHKGRAAVEFEKKTRAANLEMSRAMERNMVSMQREKERLLAELADAEKRARAAAAAAANPSSGYIGNYENPNMPYDGVSYPPYPIPMHQAQPVVGDGGPYGPPLGGHAPLVMHQPHTMKQ